MGAAAITKAPCAKCPFRKDVPVYLRKGRRSEIARALLQGGEFPCHATVEYHDDDETEHDADTSGASFCSGAAKALLAAGTDNQMLRIMERLGVADLDDVEARGPEVWDIVTWQTLPEGATADEPVDDEDGEEIETCVNSDPGCLAPAGYLEGGSIVYGTDAADGECSLCGDPLCSNCADAEGRCIMCSDES